MVWTKRPGTGIPSHKLNEVIGKVALNNLKSNTMIKCEDIN